MRRTTITVAIVLCITAAGCTQAEVGSPHFAYAQNTTALLNSDDGRTYVISTENIGSGCVQAGDVCVNVQDARAEDARSTCAGNEDGPADVVIADGKIVAIVCYPPAGGSNITELDGSGKPVPAGENGMVVTFGAETDGSTVTGDVVVYGNNVTIWGNGPDKTTLAGNVTLYGNNAVLRGLHVIGNVQVSANNATALYLVVSGDVTVDGNNLLCAGSDVTGALTSGMNNHVLVQNGVSGGWNLDGHNLACAGNRAGEGGAALECGGE